MEQLKLLNNKLNVYPIDKLHLLIEEILDLPVNETRNRYCDECECDMIFYDYFYTCPVCGIVDDAPVYNIKHESEYFQKPILYKRRIYCEDKLKLMSTLKSCRSIGYGNAKKTLTEIEDEFSTIDELFFKMKEYSLSKYYPHIYNLWFEIKKTKLITLTYQQIDMLSSQFVELDCIFKANRGNRKNMINYNTIIYYLMKKNKIKGRNNILLPYNHDSMYKILTDLENIK